MATLGGKVREGSGEVGGLLLEEDDVWKRQPYTMGMYEQRKRDDVEKTTARMQRKDCLKYLRLEGMLTIWRVVLALEYLFGRTTD